MEQSNKFAQSLIKNESYKLNMLIDRNNNRYKYENQASGDRKYNDMEMKGISCIDANLKDKLIS